MYAFYRASDTGRPIARSSSAWDLLYSTIARSRLILAEVTALSACTAPISRTGKIIQSFLSRGAVRQRAACTTLFLLLSFTPVAFCHAQSDETDRPSPVPSGATAQSTPFGSEQSSEFPDVPLPQFHLTALEADRTVDAEIAGMTAASTGQKPAVQQNRTLTTLHLSPYTPVYFPEPTAAEPP